MMQNTSHSPPFSLPLRYMLTGMVGFVLFAVDLVIQFPTLAAGTPSTAHVVALTHLLTLAVLLSFVMGAVYQLLTVAFLTPLRWLFAARVNYWAYVSGVVGLWVSMQLWSVSGLFWFGSLVTLTVLVYAIVIIGSILTSSVKGALRGFVFSAHVYLALAVVMAWLMLLSMKTGFLEGQYMRILGTHITLAAGGFFIFLLIGFSYKLFPMFTLSHGFSTARQPYTLGLFQGSLWLLIAYIWLPSQWLFGASILAGLAGTGLEVLDLREMYKKRMRKRVDRPVLFVLTAVMLAAIGFVGFILFAFSSRTMAGWQDMVSFYLLGVIVLTVISYAYKIVPFLVWTYRYGKRAGKEKIPMMADLLNLNLSLWTYVPYLLGLALLLVGVAVTMEFIAMVGCLLLAASLFTFAGQMFYVLDLRKVPGDLLDTKARV
ncbi:hypothetical protein [Alicyclobacillus sp. SO9]|uniref:hypothetical protein n=1 Tax=Alicyclobacillus sp. SO9 TaxID=2665646 RepID=UPI0018E902AE|nr:hypothetical protein [Alicyclobacillus sp. SO9]QQE81000.1 hypothetical protein GI364_11830 [Alicyclobacillus sp. SO9]